MDYKSIIFDLDGTLIDSVGDICEFANKALENYGFPTHTIDNYIDWIGNGARRLIQCAVPAGTDEATFETLYAEYLKIYELEEHKQSVLYDGIPQLLDFLTEKGIPFSIVTNKPHAVMLRTIEAYFSKWKFEYAIGQRDGLPRKPDPTDTLYIAKQLGLEPETMLFIGDSAVDVNTGHAAGMSTICLTAGYETRDNLIASKPSYMLEKHIELLPLLKY